MTKKHAVPNDQTMTAERKKMLDQLSEADVKAIDDNILENASSDWSKVSRIVLTTMIERDEGVTGLPETFYSERVANLVKEGLLESRGDVTDMHRSEVRLAKKT